MVTGWKNLTAFKQHAEEMESFRRAHENLLQNKILKAAPPVPEQSDSAFGADGRTLGSNPKNPVVSIWDVYMPKGSEN